MIHLKNSFINEWEEKQEKPKQWFKIYLQNTYIASALALALLAWGWYLIHQTTRDKSENNNKELVVKKDPYPFEKHTLEYRDNNTTFFTKNLQLQKETLAPGVHIIRDAGLVFYIVQPEDIKTQTEATYTSQKKGKKNIKVPHTTIHQEADFDKIRNKLSALPEFSYLKEPEYDRTNPNNKTKSFNIPKESVTVGMYIPIPLDHKIREISPMDFANYCYEAIEDMKNDSTKYGKEVQELLTYTTEKELITAMLSFARSETAAEYTNFVQPLGEVELHRREPNYNSFSFTYFHILMEKNADGKTPGPGLKARLKLWLTEWQCYHPKNAAKLFLAYRIEKTHGNLKNIFPLTKNNIKNVSTKYNWSSTYAEKLGPNFEFTTKLMNGEIIYYDDTQLKKEGFIYTGLNSQYQHVYKFKTPKWIHSNDKLKKIVVEEFNKNKPADCPEISEDDLITQSHTKLSGDIIPDTILIKVPKK